MSILRRALAQKQIIVYAPRITTRQVSQAMNVGDALNAANAGKGVESLQDTDGKQIFVLGVTPITADVRMGRLNP